MARIIENETSERRTIKMSVDDVISVVREYQRIVAAANTYKMIREMLESSPLFIPEDL